MVKKVYRRASCKATVGTERVEWACRTGMETEAMQCKYIYGDAKVSTAVN